MSVVHFQDVAVGDTIRDKWDAAQVAAVTATTIVLRYEDGTRMAFERGEKWEGAEVVAGKGKRGVKCG